MKISYENFEANDDGRIFNEDEINELKIPRETVFFFKEVLLELYQLILIIQLQ